MGRSKKKKAVQSSQEEELEEEKFETRLATLLLSKGLVASAEESVYLAETIITEIEESDLERPNACIAAFEDYFSMSSNDAKALLAPLLGLEETSKNQVQSDPEEEFQYSEYQNEADVDFGEEGDYIGEGECELCERYIKLTRHHLIPRSTWPRMTTRLSSAAEALSKNDVHRAGMILGPGLSHLLEPLTVIGSAERSPIKGLLQRTCNICSPCHHAVHRSHDNMTLATEYSTIELLLQDEKVYKFAKFASKQKSGKYAL